MHALGIDIGSTATKAVVLDGDAQIVSSVIIRLGAGTSGVAKALAALEENCGLSSDDIDFTVATGYGRQTYEGADAQVSELSCHARGVAYRMPTARTLIDIGGQDAKVIRIDENGMMSNFVMNEKCAAGTGRFLDVMAGVLEATVDQLGDLDAASTEAVEISSTCTVFAESEVISRLANKVPIENIVAGIHESVAQRTAGLAKRLGVKDDVVMTGGVAQNAGVVHALERVLHVNITIPDNPQINGALGAALYALDKAKRVQKNA